jgi:cytosine/adenosine deaminase-related metal-dependent hydrolase
MLLIKNGFIICASNRILEKADVVVDDKGKIAEITNQNHIDENFFTHVLDAGGKVVMPGLINAHTHSYANFVKALAENLPLEEMMFHIMIQGVYQKPEDVYNNTLLGAVEMLKGGITCCLDQLAQNQEGLNAAMEAYKDIGMRATMAPMITDKKYYDTLPIAPDLAPKWAQNSRTVSTKELIDMSTEFLKEWNGVEDRLFVGFGPSGPQRCSDDLLKGCMKETIEYDTIFHTHVLETQTQRNTAHYLYGKPMMKHLDEIGCLNEHTSMAHTVWTTKEEASLANERGAKAVHCPACNLFLGSGIAPLNVFREVGWTVGLGTDGANGGGNQNLLETMKIAALLHKVSLTDHHGWVSAAEVFDMATKNNAAILRQENQIGTLAKGKDADIVILDPSRSCSMQPIQDIIAQIVYGEGGAAVDIVMVKGQIVVEDGKCKLVDEKQVFEKAAILSKTLVEKINKHMPETNEKIRYLEQVLPRLG